MFECFKALKETMPSCVQLEFDMVHKRYSTKNGISSSTNRCLRRVAPARRPGLDRLPEIELQNGNIRELKSVFLLLLLFIRVQARETTSIPESPPPPPPGVNIHITQQLQNHIKYCKHTDNRRYDRRYDPQSQQLKMCKGEFRLRNFTFWYPVRRDFTDSRVSHVQYMFSQGRVKRV